MNQKKKILLCVCAAVVLVLALIIGLYLRDYYHADSRALEAMNSTASVTVTRDGNLTVFSPARVEAGLIFYPGCKVEAAAYAPLMSALARQNILCVLVKMPGNLAVLNSNAAEDIPEQFPEINRWYIGGHSLGGSMAASCAAKNPDLFEGLALLAAYSTEDLSESDLKVISLYGTADQVLNMEKYEAYRENLPDKATEIRIKGGNHAYFGSYGTQKGDGIASITAAEQTAKTAAYLAGFIN